VAAAEWVARAESVARVASAARAAPAAAPIRARRKRWASATWASIATEPVGSTWAASDCRTLSQYRRTRPERMQNMLDVPEKRRRRRTQRLRVDLQVDVSHESEHNFYSDLTRKSCGLFVRTSALRRLG